MKKVKLKFFLLHLRYIDETIIILEKRKRNKEK